MWPKLTYAAVGASLAGHALALPAAREAQLAREPSAAATETETATSTVDWPQMTRMPKINKKTAFRVKGNGTHTGARYDDPTVAHEDAVERCHNLLVLNYNNELTNFFWMDCVYDAFIEEKRKKQQKQATETMPSQEDEKKKERGLEERVSKKMWEYIVRVAKNVTAPEAEARSVDERDFDEAVGKMWEYKMELDATAEQKDEAVEKRDVSDSRSVPPYKKPSLYMIVSSGKYEKETGAAMWNSLMRVIPLGSTTQSMTPEERKKWFERVRALRLLLGSPQLANANTTEEEQKAAQPTPLRLEERTQPTAAHNLTKWVQNIIDGKKPPAYPWVGPTTTYGKPTLSRLEERNQPAGGSNFTQMLQDFLYGKKPPAYPWERPTTNAPKQPTESAEAMDGRPGLEPVIVRRIYALLDEIDLFSRPLEKWDPTEHPFHLKNALMGDLYARLKDLVEQEKMPEPTTFRKGLKDKFDWEPLLVKRLQAFLKVFAKENEALRPPKLEGGKEPTSELEAVLEQLASYSIWSEPKMQPDQGMPDEKKFDEKKPAQNDEDKDAAAVTNKDEWDIPSGLLRTPGIVNTTKSEPSPAGIEPVQDDKEKR